MIFNLLGLLLDQFSVLLQTLYKSRKRRLTGAALFSVLLQCFDTLNHPLSQGQNERKFVELPVHCFQFFATEELVFVLATAFVNFFIE